MKKVALNALALNPYSGGLGVYLQQLVSFFMREEIELDLQIFLNKRDAANMIPQDVRGDSLVNLEIPSRNAPVRIFKEAILWPKLLKQGHFDLFHSPMSYFPFAIPVSAVLTVHDLRSFHLDESYGIVRRTFLNQRIRSSVKTANHIIAISRFTKDGIMDLFNVPSDRISVIHEGIDVERFRMPVDQQKWSAIQQRYGLPDEYILSVGHLEPRKNYITLLQAYLRLKERVKPVPQLVIVGQKNWDYQPIFQFVSDHGLEKSIVFTHFVETDDLPAIYQKALFFITASLFEGFGFTPLEAMAAGTPVAFSNTTSLPEIVGQAGLGFNPRNPEEIAFKMEMLLTDSHLRQELINKGTENLHRFSWDICCHQTLTLYRQILS